MHVGPGPDLVPLTPCSAGDEEALPVDEDGNPDYSCFQSASGDYEPEAPALITSTDIVLNIMAEPGMVKAISTIIEFLPAIWPLMHDLHPELSGPSNSLANARGAITNRWVSHCAWWLLVEILLRTR